MDADRLDRLVALHEEEATRYANAMGIFQKYFVDAARPGLSFVDAHHNATHQRELLGDLRQAEERLSQNVRQSLGDEDGASLVFFRLSEKVRLQTASQLEEFASLHREKLEKTHPELAGLSSHPLIRRHVEEFGREIVVALKEMLPQPEDAIRAAAARFRPSHELLINDCKQDPELTSIVHKPLLGGHHVSPVTEDYLWTLGCCEAGRIQQEQMKQVGLHAGRLTLPPAFLGTVTDKGLVPPATRQMGRYL